LVDKSPEAFRTISEVAAALDVPPHVLRFWETRFSQVKPVKRGGGRRYYRPDDVRLLRGIRGLLYDDGMTIKGVQKIFRERGVRHVVNLGTLAEPPQPAREIDAALLAEAAASTVPVPADVQEQAKARPSAAGPRETASDRPQADLFGEPARADVEVAERPAAAAAAGKAPRPVDKAALRALMAELQALRAVMTRDPD